MKKLFIRYYRRVGNKNSVTWTPCVMIYRNGNYYILSNDKELCGSCDPDLEGLMREMNVEYSFRLSRGANVPLVYWSGSDYTDYPRPNEDDSMTLFNYKPDPIIENMEGIS